MNAPYNKLHYRFLLSIPFLWKKGYPCDDYPYELSYRHRILNVSMSSLEKDFKAKCKRLGA